MKLLKLLVFRRALLVLASALLVSDPILAETIILTDGTRLTGKVLSMHNSVYTIDTNSLGRVRVNSSQVSSISSGSPNSGDSSASSSFFALQKQTFQSLQKSIGSDKDAVAKIMGLQNDPLMQSILADKVIMDAVARGDYGALAENPKIQRLMNHRTVKSISRKYAN